MVTNMYSPDLPDFCDGLGLDPTELPDWYADFALPPCDRSPTHSPFSSPEKKQSKRMKHNKSGGAKTGTQVGDLLRPRNKQMNNIGSDWSLLFFWDIVFLTSTVNSYFFDSSSEIAKCLVCPFVPLVLIWFVLIFLPFPPLFYFFKAGALERFSWKGMDFQLKIDLHLVAFGIGVEGCWHGAPSFNGGALCRWLVGLINLFVSFV